MCPGFEGLPVVDFTVGPDEFPDAAEKPQSDPCLFIQCKIRPEKTVGFEIVNDRKTATHALEGFGARIAEGIPPLWRFWQVDPEFKIAFGVRILDRLYGNRHFTV